VFKVKTPQAQNIVNSLNKFTNTLYRPIRKYVPPIGGIDITPVVVIVGLYILQAIVVRTIGYGHFY
jgi:YggT family protein